ncbi:MAG: NosD domain-containing protein [Nitrososphaerota archaeon]|nr:NosD domain-containing protein [Nitrososphaerota archaeon]
MLMRLQGFLFALTMGFILTYASFPVEALNSRGAIRIFGNGDFTPANGIVGGSGTQNDPYIIEGWIIEGAHELPGIWLGNTDAYVVIRNCVVKFSYDAGIKLENVKNVLIENVTLSANHYNVHVYGSRNVKISHCMLVNTREDVVYIWGSSDITLADSRIENGRYHSLYMKDVENALIAKCVISNSLYGVYAESSTNITISSCTIRDNLGDGVNFYSVLNSTISKCKIYSNEDHGVYLDVSSRIRVEGCEIINSSLGIWLNPAFECKIIQNVFSNINLNAQDDGERNLWEMNQWSDYKGVDLNGDGYGDMPYRILGRANATDNKPVFSETPQPTPTPQTSPSPRPPHSPTPPQTPQPTPSPSYSPTPSPYTPEAQGSFPIQLIVAVIAIALILLATALLRYKRRVKT